MKVMAKLNKQSDNYNYIVEAAPSFHQLPDGGMVKDGFIVNRRTDNFDVLGKVTTQYGIVQNADLISAAEDAFKQEGLTDFKRTIVVTKDGARMNAVYDFRNKTQKLAVGDEVGLRLTVQNSFDGSLPASFLAGLLRLVCSNGMVRMDKDSTFGLTKKHGVGISTAFVHDALLKAIEGWSKSTTIFNKLATVALTQEQGHAILTRLTEGKVLSEKVREGIAQIWTMPTHREDSARNLYNLYNAATQHLTHDVAPTRFDLANRTSASILAAFERAAEDGSRLARLTAPLPADVSLVALN